MWTPILTVSCPQCFLCDQVWDVNTYFNSFLFPQAYSQCFLFEQLWDENILEYHQKSGRF